MKRKGAKSLRPLTPISSALAKLPSQKKITRGDGRGRLLGMVMLEIATLRSQWRWLGRETSRYNFQKM